FVVEDLNVAAVFADGAAVGGDGVLMQASGAQEFAHDGGNAACAVESLAEEFASGLDVREQRDVVSDGFEILHGHFNADVAGNGRDVRGAVGGAADRRVDDDGIFESFACQDFFRCEVFAHHFDNALAGFVGHAGAGSIG